MHGENLKLNL